MIKKTKIVATISDLKCDVDFIKQLYDAGMNVVRLNTAHQSLEQSMRVIENVRRVDAPIAILVDTKGPEIRTSSKGEPVSIDIGTVIRLYGDPEGQSGGHTLYVTYRNIVKDVEVGKFLLIDDGELEFRVIGKEDDFLLCQATNKGVVKLRKSVNIPDTPISLPSLSDKDREYIEFAIKHNLDFIAHSFVRTKQDVLDIKEIIDKHGSPIKIIAKIENQQGVDNIDEILDHAYGIMVARGDLGIEIAAERIPVIQRKLIKKCTESKKPVIIATQMLHTMIDHPRPTRAEVSDIANAIYQRTDSIMLSGETAYGDYPIDAVKTMTRVALEVEKNLDPDIGINIVRVKNEVTASLARSAVRACSSLPIKAIVIDTLTSRTGRYLAAYRGRIPVYAMCYNHSVMRQLSLSYGIQPIFMEPRKSRDAFLSDAISLLLSSGRVNEDDLVLVVAGSFGPGNGASFMEISPVKRLLVRNY